MHNLPRLTEAALGKIPCDLLIKNVKIFDVFSCRWVSGEVAVVDGHIVGVETGLKAKKIVNGKGRKLVPGFIDAHVHIESSLMVPQDFQNAARAPNRLRARSKSSTRQAPRSAANCPSLSCS